MDVILDIDGTLADNSHRQHFVQSEPKNWEDFFNACPFDGVIEPIAQIARLLAQGNRIIVCTGRMEKHREMTETWLAKMWGKWAKHDALYMRPDGDFRADDVVKEELLNRMLEDGYQPALAIDDRASVCRMWLRRNILLLAVNGGVEF